MGLDVAIVGQGQNGLLMTAVLANAGARRVLALDRLPERLAVSSRMGATHTLQARLSSPWQARTPPPPSALTTASTRTPL